MLSVPEQSLIGLTAIEMRLETTYNEIDSWPQLIVYAACALLGFMSVHGLLRGSGQT